MVGELWEDSARRYKEMTPTSQEAYLRASNVLPGGMNQNSRFFEPYPFYTKKAVGQYVWDLDGNKYCDYWMGHMTLILGHSPRPVVEALNEQIAQGTHYGTESLLSVELAEKVSKILPSAEMTRFCNSGAEATMYASRLARGYAKKKIVVKIEGGWHGFNPTLMRAVYAPFEEPESRGILDEDTRHIRVVPFNDPAVAEKVIQENRDELAAVLVEPVLGSAGCIPADRRFLQILREATEKVGALLIFDEIITGFRVTLGGAQRYYGVKPDLTTLGKILGGGLPIGAVTGRKEILQLASPTFGSSKSDRVGIGGGTFSGNPLTMTAGLATIRHLSQNEEQVYNTLEQKGNNARRGIEKAFEETGIKVKCTGLGSLFATHFLKEGQSEPKNASQYNESDKKNSKLFHLALLARSKIFFQVGHTAAISTAHSDEDIHELVSASEKLAENIKPAK